MLWTSARYLWPAAAVIPAPLAYIKVVAVKKLVVGFLRALRRLPSGEGGARASFCQLGPGSRSRARAQMFYLEEIRVFQAGLAGIR